MEQLPTNNEPEPRQLVAADLSAPDGLRTAVGYAESLLDGEQLEAFRQEIQIATAPGTNATPEDVLEIINAYTELVDTSGRYPQYAPKPPEE